MRAIKIDPKNQTFEEIEIEDLKDMQKVVEGLITVATDLPDGDTIYVNDEGLFNDPFFFFEIAGAHQPFIGNGLVSGVDRHGATVAAKISLEELRKITTFKDIFQVRRDLANA